MEERLQKYMARCGVDSRRKREELIAMGSVEVNGEVIREPGVKIDPARDRVKVNGKVLRTEKPAYYIHYKVKGVTTTVSDDLGRRTVMDCIPNLPERVFPVGRLDKESEGLIVLTNDGEMANFLTHPAHGVVKTYRVVAEGRINEDVIRALAEKGIRLGPVLVKPARVELDRYDNDNTVIHISVSEGINREVRRIFAAIGHEVKRLLRTNQGPLSLAGLKRGATRPFTARELKILQREMEGKDVSAEADLFPKGSAKSRKPTGPRGRPRTVKAPRHGKPDPAMARNLRAGGKGKVVVDDWQKSVGSRKRPSPLRKPVSASPEKSLRPLRPLRPTRRVVVASEPLDMPVTRPKAIVAKPVKVIAHPLAAKPVAARAVPVGKKSAGPAGKRAAAGAKRVAVGGKRAAGSGKRGAAGERPARGGKRMDDFGKRSPVAASGMGKRSVGSAAGERPSRGAGRRGDDEQRPGRGGKRSAAFEQPASPRRGRTGGDRDGGRGAGRYDDEAPRSSRGGARANNSDRSAGGRGKRSSEADRDFDGRSKRSGGPERDYSGRGKRSGESDRESGGRSKKSESTERSFGGRSSRSAPGASRGSSDFAPRGKRSAAGSGRGEPRSGSGSTYGGGAKRAAPGAGRGDRSDSQSGGARHPLSGGARGGARSAAPGKSGGKRNRK